MATYKVIQDIEAEDKFVGPLTMKQFVFAMIGCFFAWVCFFVVTKDLSWALIIFLPMSLFGFFMAFPWSKEQPTDIWVLAKIRFHFKPKKRVWDQAGRQDLVTITAPKKIEKHLTKDFSETEVKSRLKALADTIDSRGWAVKHATAAEAATIISTDRLIDPAILPQPVPDDTYDMPDMMENSKMDSMLNQTRDKQRAQISQKLDQVRRDKPDEENLIPDTAILPPEDDLPPAKNTADRIDEMLLSDKIKAKRTASNTAFGHLPTIQVKTVSSTSRQNDDADGESDGDKNSKRPSKTKQLETDQKKDVKPVRDKNISNGASTVTDQISPDILKLARNNDLNVATIARQAKNDKQAGSDDEVVISLH